MNRPVRTVVLELLREGDPHNQLLSPYTRYLARCGDACTAAVTVPYEHKEFLDLQRRLRYEGGSSEDGSVREHVLESAGRAMSRVLASIPGFVPVLNAQRDALIHLELDLWPAEIALLPFELAKMPTGAPGGQDFWLALQARTPVTITRRLRGQTGEGVVWPQRPRVLFAWSEAGGPVPHAEHLAALLNAVMPWNFPAGEPVEAADAERAGRALTMLANADLPTIQRTVAEGDFTHVHILAHGVSTSDGYDFGKLVMGTRRRKDVVDGTGLATALCPAGKSSRDRPFAVTLSSCDSGAASSVLEPGGSLAHYLHLAGMPLVIGSQFPLSKAGSVAMTRELYTGLFAGTDPRLLLHTIRERLYAGHGGQAHDWAALVCYAALPPDIDRQLEEARLARCRREIDARVARLDRALETGEQPEALLAEFAAIRDCAGRYPSSGPYSGEGLGNAASAHKRLAEIQFRLAGEGDDAELLDASIASLKEAARCYHAASRVFMLPTEVTAQRVATLHWVLTQWIGLQAVLDRGVPAEMWTTATVSARLEAEATGGVWPLGSLMELELLALDASPDAERAGRALRVTRNFVARVADPEAFAIRSTYRQIKRYASWWGSDRVAGGLGERGAARQARWRAPGGLLETARKMLETLSPD